MMVKDVIKQIVKKADISDWRNPMLSDPNGIGEYIRDFFAGGPALIRDPQKKDKFVEVCEQIMSTTDTPDKRRWGFLIIANMYDKMMKDVIVESVDAEVGTVSMDDVNNKMRELADITTQFANIRKQMKDAQDKVNALNRELSESTASKSALQFKTYLDYAADQWATDKERPVVKRVSDRIYKKYQKENAKSK